MNLKKNIHWLLLPIFIISSCARQTSPTGGPKDTIPPNLLRAVPKNQQINYTQKTIELTFDEALVLNSPKDQIIITPGIGKDFDAEVRKNTVLISIKNDLQPNTTYSVNLREAIQDITEKNPAENVKLAFSTGNYIDSLSIQGNIYDILSSKETKDATVALYEKDTFNIFKHKPSYLTKTDLKGKYTIGNLKPGEYYIYAIDDRNKNLIVDSKSEAYGYKAQKIILTENQKAIDIPLLHLDARPLKLTSVRPSGTYFNIKATKAMTDYKLSNNDGIPLYSSFAENDQTVVKIYNTFIDQDSIEVMFHGIDSVNNSADTTFYLKFLKRETKPEQFKVTSAGFRVTGDKGSIHGSIEVTKPLAKISFDSIFYQIDSTNIISLTAADLLYDTAHNLLTFTKTFDKRLLLKKEEPSKTDQKPAPLSTKPPATDTKEKKPARPTTNQLYIAASSFISVESDTSKLITEALTPTQIEKTGIIFAEVKTTEPRYVTQLLSKDLKVIKSTVNTSKSTFDDLDPGEYMLRLIIDHNGDGKWTPGNYLKQQEPEPVIFYKNEKNQTSLPLKANWETGPFLLKY